MALTLAQQQQLDALKAKEAQDKIAYDAAIIAAQQAADAANECQNKRNQYTLNWKKEQACPQSVLSQLNATWSARASERDAKETIYGQSKAAVAAYLNQIGQQVELGQQALLSDPKFNLQTQSNIMETKKAELAAAEKKRKMIIWAVIIILLIIITGFFIYKRMSKKQNTK